MSRELRVLIVEDSESDAALLVRTLTTSGLEVEWQRVENAADMRAALAAQRWDLVISDYRLPHFDAPSALATLQEAGADVPFIVVSGMIEDEMAIALMKAGSQDYLRKESLGRLAPAVAREVAEARDRERRREAEAALQASEARFRTLVETAPDAILIGREGLFVYVNVAAVRLLGASSASDLVGHPILEFMHPAYHEAVRAMIQRVTVEHVPIGLTEAVCLRIDGSEVHVEASAVPFDSGGERGSIVFARDITERKRTEAALAEQVAELRRWHAATLGRETRILELKGEVNRLLGEVGRPLRYSVTDLSSREIESQ